MVRRPPQAGKRQIRRALAAKIAAEAIGPLAPGCEIFGLSKGQFSLIDVICHVLAATGRADVVVSTWTAANADLGFAYRLLADGAIRSLRFVVDFSFPTRQPAYCAALRARFGDDCVRVTKTHAKFVVIRNDTWNVVIRSSMNLNENRRLESFEISDDAGMAAFCCEVVDELFQFQASGEGFTNGPWENCKRFEVFAEGGAEPAAIPESTDSGRYFGAGPHDRDIRRAGVTYGSGR
jgi:hypothetical protein